MSARNLWINAFPVAKAEDAVRAVKEAWSYLTLIYRPYFNPKIKEPDITLILVSLLRDVVSEQLGLRGQWGAENVSARIDVNSGKILEKRRADINYLWNNDCLSINIIIEFKKFRSTKTSIDNYCGEEGMLRFISGYYSKKQPIALMAGIIMDDYTGCMSKLLKKIQEPETMLLLQLVQTDENEAYYFPSRLFPAHAEFDTEHLRPEEMAPAHGTINLSHFFLSFGYSI